MTNDSQHLELIASFGLDSKRIDVPGGVLHVVSSGDTSKETIVFLHGYPDSARVWFETMQKLALQYHVVTFDLRGVGLSRPVRSGADYLIDRLLPDIEAVINATAGEHAKVHLVGHDWGSTIGWSFVTHPEFGLRVLSWSSMSGPHLGMWMNWGIEAFKSFAPGRIAAVVRQLFKSSYVLFLVAFPIPALIWRIFHVKLWRMILRFAGVPQDDPMLEESQTKVLSMAIAPMSLYRRNIIHPPAVPARSSFHIPTLLFIPEGDNFVTPASFDNVEDYATNVTVRRVDGFHWAQRSHNDIFVREIGNFIESTRRNI